MPKKSTSRNFDFVLLGLHNPFYSHGGPLKHILGPFGGSRIPSRVAATGSKVSPQILKLACDWFCDKHLVAALSQRQGHPIAATRSPCRCDQACDKVPVAPSERPVATNIESVICTSCCCKCFPECGIQSSLGFQDFLGGGPCLTLQPICECTPTP